MDKENARKRDSNGMAKRDHDRLDQEKSVPARILESATNLVQSGFHGSKNSAALSLSKVLAEEEKLGSSSSFSSAHSRDTESSAELSRTSETGRSSTTASAGESFRSVRPEIDKALLSPDEDVKYSPMVDSRFYTPDLLDTSCNKLDPKGKSIAHGHSRDSLSMAHDKAMMENAWSHNIMLAQDWVRLDGAEVTELLSDPNFDPLAETDVENSQEKPIPLSNEDMETANLFHKHVLSNEIDQGTAQGNDGADSFSTVSSSSTGLSHQFESALSSPVNGRNLHNLDTFFADIMNYHEDVWGYAQPLVEDVRREVKNTPTGQAPDGPALQRLRMIFEHVNK